jgi:hypothetical protein
MRQQVAQLEHDDAPAGCRPDSRRQLAGPLVSLAISCFLSALADEILFSSALSG